MLKCLIGLIDRHRHIPDHFRIYRQVMLKHRPLIATKTFLEILRPYITAQIPDPLMPHSNEIRSRLMHRLFIIHQDGIQYRLIK